jgi:hypothetical protein
MILALNNFLVASYGHLSVRKQLKSNQIGEKMFD